MRGFIVVSGLPCSGKSTIGQSVSTALDWRLLDKDAFLEALFESDGIDDVAMRHLQSREADRILQQEASRTESAVLVSWWRHPRSQIESGTPIDWLPDLSAKQIEIHCLCPSSLAVERFLARRRHPGHQDQRWSRKELEAMFAQQAQLGAVLPGSAIIVDTAERLDIEALVLRVRKALGSPGM